MLDQHKIYPRVAQQRRQQGRAMIRLVVDRMGRVIESSLTQSSGYPILDREVADLIARVSPLPPPRHTSADRVELILPIDFMLR